MPEVVLGATRLGFLALLWIFVFAALGVIRSDLFGTRKQRRAGNVQRPSGARAAPPPKAKRRRTAHSLVVTEGKLAGTRIGLGDAPITIGRAHESTLVLTDDYASTHHARLTSRDGEWYLEDVGSTNGTYLDRTRVHGPMPVPLGTPIRIGKTVLELRS
jgi:hypothetical protein